MTKPCPSYLQAHASTWETDPLQANRDWFAAANYGLFLHYGLYSILGEHEWQMFRQQIPVAEYEKLFDQWDPSAFDADAICDLAIEAGMRYINLTTCHHEGFCLWDSQVEAFNSMQACGRDLVRELGEACDRKGLGFFLYFTYIPNWRHPYALTRGHLFMCRPDYPDGDERYVLTSPDEWRHFWDWSHGCIRELCSFDFPVAGIWLDIIRAYYLQPDLIPVTDTYALIRECRPEALISFKQGATGTEDFAAPEFHFKSQGDILRRDGHERGAQIADAAWESNRHKHNEICLTLQDRSWGWNKNATHKNPEELWTQLAYARAHNCNLLANTGPLLDGSIHAEDLATLRAVGQRLRDQGWPAPDAHVSTTKTATGAGAE